jgi:glutamate/tyrosine decarboxylase-like PLP-dependent enzyme
MIERIKELEKTARLLEPTPEQRADLREPVLRYTENFLNRIKTLPTYVMTPDKGAGLLDSPIGDDPIDMDAALRLIEKHVDTPGLNPASGGHLGYIPGGGIYTSSLADYMAAVTNRYAGVFFASPGAVRMENMLIDWMADMVGYPKTAAGNLASGGSIANLIAIVTARDSHRLKGRELERTVIYATEHAHHCIDKALRIAGVRECIRRNIVLDSRYRMDAAALEHAIEKDKADGLRPWLVIASAGTVDVGAVDPLDDIGRIAKKHGLWYHVDGAYGAFFALTDEGKRRLKGIERSDSVVMDPHKGLFLPYGLGVVLVRDRDKLHQAHHYQANYMQDTHVSREELSPAELSPELTKHFRGLRLWLPLKLLGVKPFRAALEEKMLLALYFYHEIQKLGFRVGPEPELSVVTYRYGDSDEFNAMLQREVMADGRVFISSTMLDGKFTLRLAVLSFRTHLQTVDTLLDLLKSLLQKRH